MPAAAVAIGAFAGAAAGVAAVGAATTVLGTIAGYALVAGSVLTGVGAVTGKKSLMKLGAVLSLAGGVGSLAAGAASATGSSAVSGMDLAADAAAGSANSVSGASAALGSGAAASTAPALGDITLGSAWEGLGSTAIPGDLAASAADPLSAGLNAASTSATPSALAGAQPTSLMDMASQRVSTLGSTGDAGQAMQIGAPVDAVAEQAKGLTMKDVQTLWDKAKGATKGVGQFIKDNKELVQIAGGALNSAYGPEAELVDLKRSLMDRQRRNLNSPALIQPLKPIGT